MGGGCGAEHDADTRRAVCKIRHQPLAERAEELQLQVLAGLIAGALATTAYAQDTGIVRGAVTFTDGGAPVHGAVVLVVGPSLVTLTDENGVFEIPDVPAGTHEVLAQREHLTAARQTVTVQTGDAVVVDFMLELTAIHEELTVMATAGE